MKTAIIKTDFWKEDRIFELLPDARYFYLCLLTNPERNATAAFKCSDRLIAAYTGYNSDTIKLCQGELVNKGFIEIVDGYYIVNEQDYVSLTKGKLSSNLYEKEFSSLPLSVQEKLLSRSGATPERISNSISNSNSMGISKSSKTPIPEQALRLAELLHSLVRQRYNLKERPNEIEASARQIDLLNRRDGQPYEAIEAVLRWSQEDDFWQQNIRSGSKLRQKFVDLMIKASSETKSKQREIF